MRIVYDRLPLPPNGNHQYSQTRSGRRFPSKALKDYKKAMKEWGEARPDLLNESKIKLDRELVDQETVILVHMIWNCPEYSSNAKVLGYKNLKDSKVKKWDITNRIKSVHDCLSDLLKIDDKYFGSGIVSKALIGEDEKPCLTVILNTMKISSRMEMIEKIRIMDI